jgi:protein-S-isoprenylcysteine O-methyltransferase Ste14
MQFLPDFSIDIVGGWWFSLSFLMVNMFIALKYPGFRRKALVFPRYRSFVERISMIFTILIFQGRVLMAIFIPISFTMPFFAIGMVGWLLGLTAYLVSIITFSSSSPDAPVVSGIYRLTRNPQQISLIMMWSSAGLILGTFLFPLLGFIEMVMAYPGFKAQERFCLEKFGDKYKEYMNQVPRYMMKGRSLA